NRQKAVVDKLYVSIYPSEEELGRAWPLTSLNWDKFREKCALCDNSGYGTIIDGITAQEMMKKVQEGEVIKEEFFRGYPSIKVYYEAIWPNAPDVPPDATLTCNTKSVFYPLLPLH